VMSAHPENDDTAMRTLARVVCIGSC